MQRHVGWLARMDPEPNPSLALSIETLHHFISYRLTEKDIRNEHRVL